MFVFFFFVYGKSLFFARYFLYIVDSKKKKRHYFFVSSQFLRYLLTTKNNIISTLRHINFIDLPYTRKMAISRFIRAIILNIWQHLSYFFLSFFFFFWLEKAKNIQINKFFNDESLCCLYSPNFSRRIYIVASLHSWKTY